MHIASVQVTVIYIKLGWLANPKQMKQKNMNIEMKNQKEKPQRRS